MKSHDELKHTIFPSICAWLRLLLVTKSGKRNRPHSVEATLNSCWQITVGCFLFGETAETSWNVLVTSQQLKDSVLLASEGSSVWKMLKKETTTTKKEKEKRRCPQPPTQRQLRVFKLPLVATVSPTVNSQQREILLIAPTGSRKASYHCCWVTVYTPRYRPI